MATKAIMPDDQNLKLLGESAANAVLDVCKFKLLLNWAASAASLDDRNFKLPINSAASAAPS